MVSALKRLFEKVYVHCFVLYLLADEAESEIYEKKFLASFVGSITHPLRVKILEKYSKNNKIY